MRSTFFALAAALLCQTALATPLTSKATDSGAEFPVVDISGVQARPLVPLSQGGIHVDTTQAEFPATLLLCSTPSCISCIGIDLSSLPMNECLTPDITFQTAVIRQPSAQGLPFTVFVGPPGCASFVPLSTVNTCYNLNSTAFSDFALA
ncbi:hypothetical protein BN946_scf184548.g4 [Trametes cinnabarina]|uniref:Uncharacterized protein n=1 Tax=Pycnoporus cinnabarinus TaxID=5643 RepID=A0A060SN72_PYCCI|nr:hypothetical protein BN946_scf184548.g4 [Trametes cinnabarina]